MKRLQILGFVALLSFTTFLKAQSLSKDKPLTNT
jgi:hypothetical protein